jgi:hypothetical protein
MTGPQGPAGQALAAAEFGCSTSSTVTTAGQPINFQGRVVFGSSSISTTGTAPFSTFVVQQGIYQIHLSGNGFSPTQAGTFPDIVLLENSLSPGVVWNTIGDVASSGVRDIVGGARLIEVTASNVVLQFVGDFDMLVGTCALDITRLQ